MKIAHLYLAVATVVLSFSFSTAAQSGQPAKTAPTPTPTVTAKPMPTPVTKATPSPTPTAAGKKELPKPDFPEVARWTKSDANIYPQKALGYSITYESDNDVRATIYVYDGGHAQIPNDLKGLVKDELAKATKELFAMQELGYYKDVKETKNETVTIGGTSGKVKAVHAEYTFTSQGNKMNSETYIFPYKNHFVKFRISRPAAAAVEAAKSDVASLLQELDELFGN